jgi:aprataxin
LTPDSEAASAEEIERVPACDPHSLFMVGYHSVPSLYPLHLHIVSRDLQSSALKNKKHWNSFTTPFFLAAAKVEGWLRDGLTARSQMQSYPMRYEALLKEPMLCNRCGALLKNMPHLKQHQDTCLSNPKYT